MRRNFSELKSVGGGDNSYAVPHPGKWGDASPRPPPIDARAHNYTRTFLDYMYSFELYTSITKPSRITDISATFIDNIFTNELQFLLFVVISLDVGLQLLHNIEEL